MPKVDLEEFQKALADEKRQPVRKLAIEIAKAPQPTEIQSLIFDKKKFKTADKATKWALDHEFSANKVDETETSFRLRQRQPADFVSTSFRTISLDTGVSAVVGRLRTVAKSVPAKRQKRERTREYLERALTLAKDMLPGWAYIALMRSARGHAGGAVRARMRAEEKLALQKVAPTALTNEELHAAQKRLGGLVDDLVRKDQEARFTGEMLERVEREMEDRRMPTSMRKGFVSGSPDGGAHAHGLARESSKTSKDGVHQHVFAMPGTGEIVHTHHDGEHEHTLGDKSDPKTSNDGAHSHHVLLSNGDSVETLIDGRHSHGLMLETSNFDGQHVHVLKLQDGSELKSMTIMEWLLRFGVPPATVLHNATMVTQVYADSQRPCEPELPTSEQAVALMASGADLAPVFETVAEVVDAAEDPAVIRFGGDDEVYAATIGKTELEPGDLVDVEYDGTGLAVLGHATATEPTGGAMVEALLVTAAEITKALPLDFVGPQLARVVFVAHQPSPLEVTRREALVGPNGAKFAEAYLAPLNLSKTDVAMGFAVPSLMGGDLDWSRRLDSQLARWPEAPVVALGKEARQLLGDRACMHLPHPGAIRKKGDRGEVGRKLRTLRRKLDTAPVVVEHEGTDGSGPIPKGSANRILADFTGGLRNDGAVEVSIAKTVDEKQIVYGVVLDPYVVDLQGDWIPPADIESTAHDFTERSRVIGFEHFAKADATLVESFVEQYPSQGDYEAAMQNRPHKVNRRKFGDDQVNSGAWVAGVKLSDGLWEMYKTGKLNAFSIGGFSSKTKVTTQAMPDVEFIDLEPSGS